MTTTKFQILKIIFVSLFMFGLASYTHDPLDFFQLNSNPVKQSSTRIATPVEGLLPTFVEPIPNITIPAGRNVTLPCTVDNLGAYRVAWIHTDRHTLITLHDRLITRSSKKYGITHNSYRTWWLHIAELTEKDSGEYMCQVNTSPMRSQVGYLDVVVPPKINELQTSSDQDCREGGDVFLKCVANGSPTPTIKWRREGDDDISPGTKIVSGEWLNITKISRMQMGAYLCIASNKVPPSISKRIMVNVNFAPMIWIPIQIVGTPVESDVVLDCNLESYPKSITYWTRHNGIMVLSNNKYNSTVLDAGLYKVQLKLTIKNVRHDDFGSYSCVAKNALGETEGSIRLYEITRPSNNPSSSTKTNRMEKTGLSSKEMKTSIYGERVMDEGSLSAEGSTFQNCSPEQIPRTSFLALILLLTYLL